MDDLDVLARDFGFRPQGKSNPMRSDQADHRPFRSVDDQNRDGLLFNDVFGGPPKYTSSSSSNNNSNNNPSSMSDFDYESIFKSESKVSNSNTGGNKTSTLPVYDKPVYDDDIFDGLPGLKNKLGTSSVRFEDDIFASIASPSTKSKNQNDFDDLLGNLGGNDKFGENNNSKSSSAKSSSTSRGLDDLLAGFGGGIPASSNRKGRIISSVSILFSHRPISESSRGYIQTDNTTSNVMEDPFVVMESTSTPGSSSGVSTDPLEEIGKLGKSRSARAEASSVSDGVFDDLDPLNGFGKPVHPFYPGRDNGGKDGSPSRSGTSVSSGVREQTGKSDRYSGSNVEKKVPFDNFQEPPLFASAAAKMSQQKNDNDLESFFGMGSRASSVPRARTDSVDPLFNQQFQEKAGSEAAKRTSFSSGASNMRKASSTTNIVDDLSSIFGAAESSGAFQEVEGETEERRRARLERHQRTQERAAKALAEKNQRDLQAQRDQEERHRIAETLDIEIKRWAAGKEGNLRALLSTMQYVRILPSKSTFYIGLQLQFACFFSYCTLLLLNCYIR
ncbi:auxilin-related protein 2-like [Olea europaea var. sylvestris]|uniref:auxilin-related protein 2-like n=1 Tax=Olea europaea var. sylvestris TaxID=158386 RepID=UPI000C1D48EC|nr:auxilin-related protein 2-like [Olea europaea var. sylvestris]